MSKSCVVVGNSKVGKTSLVEQYKNIALTRRITILSSPAPTVVADYYSLRYREDNYSIWDLSGNVNNEHTYKKYIEKTEICFLCFDLTNEKSFLDLSKWLNLLRRSSPDISIILIGTKDDLIDERVISQERIDRFCQENAIPENFNVSTKFKFECKALFDSLEALSSIAKKRVIKKALFLLQSEGILEQYRPRVESLSAFHVEQLAALLEVMQQCKLLNSYSLDLLLPRLDTWQRITSILFNLTTIDFPNKKLFIDKLMSALNFDNLIIPAIRELENEFKLSFDIISPIFDFPAHAKKMAAGLVTLKRYNVSLIDYQRYLEKNPEQADIIARVIAELSQENLLNHPHVEDFLNDPSMARSFQTIIWRLREREYTVNDLFLKKMLDSRRSVCNIDNALTRIYALKGSSFDEAFEIILRVPQYAEKIIFGISMLMRAELYSPENLIFLETYAIAADTLSIFYKTLKVMHLLKFDNLNVPHYQPLTTALIACKDNLEDLSKIIDTIQGKSNAFILMALLTCSLIPQFTFNECKEFFNEGQFPAFPRKERYKIPLISSFSKSTAVSKQKNLIAVLLSFSKDELPFIHYLLARIFSGSLGEFGIENEKMLHNQSAALLEYAKTIGSQAEPWASYAKEEMASLLGHLNETKLNHFLQKLGDDTEVFLSSIEKANYFIATAYAEAEAHLSANNQTPDSTKYNKLSLMLYNRICSPQSPPRREEITDTPLTGNKNLTL